MTDKLTDAPTPPILPRSLLDLIGAYGCARTDGMNEFERLGMWERLIVGIKAYASQYNTDTERDLAACRAETDEWRERCFAMTATADRIGGLQRQAAAGEGRVREEVNRLSIELAECRAALRELDAAYVALGNVPENRPMTHFAALDRLSAAQSAARAILQSTGEGEKK